jgi:hypothetical protein
MNILIRVVYKILFSTLCYTVFFTSAFLLVQPHTSDPKSSESSGKTFFFNLTKALENSYFFTENTRRNRDLSEKRAVNRSVCKGSSYGRPSAPKKLKEL